MGSVITYLDVVTNHQRIYAFVQDPNNHLKVNYWDGSAWHWADQGTPPNTTVKSSVAATTFAPHPAGWPEQIYAFVVGQDDHLYVNYWNGSSWRWADQGTPPGTTIAAACEVVSYLDGNTNRIYAFVVGQNGHLYTNYWDGSTWYWADQGRPSSAMVGAIAPGPIAFRRFLFGHPRPFEIYVFVVGDDGHLYLNHWDGRAWSWADQGAPFGTAVDSFQPSVVTYDLGPGLHGDTRRIYAFVAGQNGHLYVNYWDGSAWHWADQGTPPSTKLETLHSGATTYIDVTFKEHIHAFVVGRNFRLYMNYWDGSVWHWADQGTPQGTIPLFTDGVIATLSGAGEQVYAFVSDPNRALFVNYWNGSVWQWSNQHGP
jgi:hypothetical protein